MAGHDRSSGHDAGTRHGDPVVDHRVRLTALVEGYVQGVGFRAWARRTATELGLSGSATNLPGGDVEVVAQGRETACVRLLSALRSGSTPGRVTRVRSRWSEVREPLSGFVER